MFRVFFISVSPKADFKYLQGNFEISSRQSIKLFLPDFVPRFTLSELRLDTCPGARAGPETC